MDSFKIDDLEIDNNYAVFVSYVEIYNNYVYDLLEDLAVDPISGIKYVSYFFTRHMLNVKLAFYNYYVLRCLFYCTCLASNKTVFNCTWEVTLFTK